MSDSFDPYRVLQVLQSATQDEIKVAYRRLARRYHPDRATDGESHDRMIELNRAWELIGAPEKRACYDDANGIVRSPRSGPAATGGPASGAEHEVFRGAPRHDAAPHAGPPPGNPSGSVMTWGRYSGWSLGEIARVEPEYLEWLGRAPIGWQYRDQIRAILDQRPSTAPPTRQESPPRRGRLFR